MTFQMAEPPASGLPSAADVEVPKTSVVALLVTRGDFRHELHTGLVRTLLYDAEQGFGNYRGELIHTSGVNIAKARNELFRRFLAETDAEWAWMLDSDMDIPEQTLPRLLCAAAVSGAKVIGGLCVMVGSDGPIPTIYQLGDTSQNEVTRVMLDYPDNTIVQIAATGAACLLVHRTVIEHFAALDRTYPWFYEDEITGQWVSEDIMFTLRCNEAGFPVYVDCTTPIGHVKGSTTWWPKHIREKRGFPNPKTYAIIPSKNVALSAEMCRQLSGQGLERIVMLDNRDEAEAFESDEIKTIPMPGAGIHEMWNVGIDWCLEDSAQRRNVNLLILNDDLKFGPRFVSRMVEALRSDGNLVAVSGNYDNREHPELVQEVDDICAGRYDGTGGLAGFAFAAKGEWFGSGYRFPEECKWWYGDNDLVLAARASGVGKIGIAIDAHVEHLDGGGNTGGDWSEHREQLERDRQAFESRWASQAVEPATVQTQTISVISSIFGGYDNPCPLVLQTSVRDYVMVTDEPSLVAPWRYEHQKLPDGIDPRYQGKAAKYQPWLFTDADVVVWLDGRVQTTKPGFVSWLIDCLGDADMALYRHPTRSSILDEAYGALAEDEQRPAKYTGRDLVGQAKHYLVDGYEDVNLWQTTFYVARRNERTIQLGKRWQEEQDRFPDCLLDQIPFAPLVAECGVKVADLPGNFWSRHGDLFVLRPHIDGT